MSEDEKDIGLIKDLNISREKILGYNWEHKLTTRFVTITGIHYYRDRNYEGNHIKDIPSINLSQSDDFSHNYYTLFGLYFIIFSTRHVI